jgi:hypothetical protein
MKIKIYIIQIVFITPNELYESPTSLLSIPNNFNLIYNAFS